MDTKSKEKKKWLYVAAGALGVAVLSMFTTILSYKSAGTVYSYNLLGLIEGNDFTQNVLANYRGTVYWRIDGFWVTLLTVVSLASLICSIVGLFTLRQQRPNIKQFWLTIIGLAGTSLPALLVLIAVPMFRSGFQGELTYGIYPVVAPIATLVSVLAVYRRKNRVQEELRKELEDKRKIWKADSTDLMW